jgi:hypothetical protein
MTCSIYCQAFVQEKYWIFLKSAKHKLDNSLTEI